MKDAKGIINALKEAAKAELRDTKKLIPRLFMVVGSPGDVDYGIAFIECSSFFETTELKQQLPMVVRHVWETQFPEEQQNKLEAVCVIHDAWVTQRSSKGLTCDQIQEMLNTVQPSQDPNRLEALVMIICWKEKVDIVNMCYLRIGDQILFVEEDQLGGIADGTLSRLYPH
jgi:hypothetical protein